jgi:hypothetical protein
VRVPSNRPIAYLWYLLAVVGMGGVILVAQILGLGAPRHFPSRSWLVAAGAVSALVCAIGARGIIRINREMKDWVAGDHPWAREDVAARMGPVLAHWAYARDEWEAWTEREYRSRSREARGFGVGAAVLGGAMAAARGASAPLVAAAAAVMLVAGWASWRAWALRMRNRNRTVREPSITIAANAVLVDGKRDYLGDASCRTSSVRLLQGEAPPVLEITIAYPGRVLRAFPVRVPVPRGREDEADALVRIFAAGRWNAPQGMVTSGR